MDGPISTEISSTKMQGKESTETLPTTKILSLKGHRNFVHQEEIDFFSLFLIDLGLVRLHSTHATICFKMLDSNCENYVKDSGKFILGEDGFRTGSFCDLLRLATGPAARPLGLKRHLRREEAFK